MTIEERVIRLELENHRLKRSVRLAGLCLVLIAGMGAVAATADPVRTKETLQVNDTNGRVRIQLHAHNDFGPMISLHDNEGKERVRIGSDQNANGKPFIWFFNKDREVAKSIE